MVVLIEKPSLITLRCLTAGGKFSRLPGVLSCHKLGGGRLGARHEGHRIRHAEVLGIDRAQTAAKAVDMDAVRHFEDMRHVMRNQHDR